MKKIISVFCATAMTVALSNNANVFAEKERARWTIAETSMLHKLNQAHHSMEDIAKIINENFHTNRTAKACKEKLEHPLFSRIWSEEETNRLIQVSLSSMGKNKQIKWGQVASYFPGRTPRECQRQFENKAAGLKTTWSSQNDELLLKHAEALGKRWFIIAHLFGVSPSTVKNRYQTLIRSREKDESDIESEDTFPKIEVPEKKELLPLELNLEDFPSIPIDIPTTEDIAIPTVEDLPSIQNEDIEITKVEGLYEKHETKYQIPDTLKIENLLN